MHSVGLRKSMLRYWLRLMEAFGSGFTLSLYLYLWSQLEHCILRLLTMSALIFSSLLLHTQEQKTLTSIPEQMQMVKMSTRVTKNIIERGDRCVTTIDSYVMLQQQMQNMDMNVCLKVANCPEQRQKQQYANTDIPISRGPNEANSLPIVRYDCFSKNEMWQSSSFAVNFRAQIQAQKQVTPSAIKTVSKGTEGEKLRMEEQMRKKLRKQKGKFQSLLFFMQIYSHRTTIPNMMPMTKCMQ